MVDNLNVTLKKSACSHICILNTEVIREGMCLKVMQQSRAELGQDTFVVVSTSPTIQFCPSLRGW